MEAWRGSAAGALIVVAPGGVGKSAFSVTLARRAIDEGFASRAAFVDARGSSATRASLMSALGAACRVHVNGEDVAPLIKWACG
jgi:Mrp family chromosome partitioning ATPase